jgi:hypothetical protein
VIEWEEVQSTSAAQHEGRRRRPRLPEDPALRKEYESQGIEKRAQRLLRELHTFRAEGEMRQINAQAAREEQERWSRQMDMIAGMSQHMANMAANVAMQSKVISESQMALLEGSKKQQELLLEVTESLRAPKPQTDWGAVLTAGLSGVKEVGLELIRASRDRYGSLKGTEEKSPQETKPLPPRSESKVAESTKSEASRQPEPPPSSASARPSSEAVSAPNPAPPAQLSAGDKKASEPPRNRRPPKGSSLPLQQRPVLGRSLKKKRRQRRRR